MTEQERATIVVALRGITDDAVASENARLMFIAGVVYATEKAVTIVNQIGD
jgi:hypothetical protein